MEEADASGGSRGFEWEPDLLPIWRQEMAIGEGTAGAAVQSATSDQTPITPRQAVRRSREPPAGEAEEVQPEQQQEEEMEGGRVGGSGLPHVPAKRGRGVRQTERGAAQSAGAAPSAASAETAIPQQRKGRKRKGWEGAGEADSPRQPAHPEQEHTLVHSRLQAAGLGHSPNSSGGREDRVEAGRTTPSAGSDQTPDTPRQLRKGKGRLVQAAPRRNVMQDLYRACGLVRGRTRGRARQKPQL